MITQDINVKIVKSAEDAPNYNTMEEKFTPIKMKTAIIVRDGTREGRPTVDIQCEDAEGNKFLIMTTGRILTMVTKLVGQ